MKLDKHPRGWRLRIGGKAIYLNCDETKARTIATVIAAKWDALAAIGHKTWPDAELQAALRTKALLLNAKQLPTPTPAAAPAPAPVVTPPQPAPLPLPPLDANGLTLHSAIDRYILTVDARTGVSLAWKLEEGSRCRSLKHCLSDRLLASIDTGEIQKMIAVYLARPAAQTKKLGHRLSPYCCLLRLKQLKVCLLWADEQGLWTAPRQMVKLFRIGIRSFPMSPSERQGMTQIKTFTMDQLKILYTKGDDRIKLFLLLGLNCGYGSSEISGLACADIHNLHTSKPVISKERPKTGVFGRWELWPETVKLLRKQIAGKGPDDLVFVCPKTSGPICRVAGRGRVDAIQLIWTRYTKWCKVEHLSFKYLRKTSSQWIRDLSRLELSEAFLAHAERGVSTAYNRVSLDQLQPVIWKLRKKLVPVLGELPKAVDKAA